MIARLAAPLACAVMLVAGGCASTLPAEVTTFHRLPSANALAGRSYLMVPTEEQRASLEYASYADRVRQALARHSLVEAPGSAAADYSVALRLASTAAPSAWRGSPGTSVGVSGGGFSFGGLGVGIGVGIPIGRGREPTSTWRHEVEVAIDRRDGASPVGSATSPAPSPVGGETSPPSPSTSRLYEARAVTENESPSIASVAGALIDAVFQSFPGENGQTRVVEVPLQRP